MMDYDATSLYPSAMWDDIYTYPKLETGYAFTPDMNGEIVEKFINQRFQPGSAISKNKLFNPRDLIFQQLPDNEKS